MAPPDDLTVLYLIKQVELAVREVLDELRLPVAGIESRMLSGLDPPRQRDCATRFVHPAWPSAATTRT